MKDIELRLLSELVKNSHRSDRELAKVLGSSQPTITRIRKRLEKEEIIRDYTMIPDLAKLGIELVAFTFAAWHPEMEKRYSGTERIEKAKRFVSNHPNVIFASSGHGLGMERVILTVHKNYSDYDKFMNEAESQYAGLLSRLESFTLSLKTDAVVSPLSVRNLMEYVAKTE